MINGVSVATWVLRVVAAIGPVVALLAAVPAGYVPPVILVVLVVAGSVGYALTPENVLGLVVMVTVLAWWVLVVGEAAPLGSVVAAAGLLAAHVAGLLMGLGPSRLVVAPGIYGRWAARAVAVWLVAPGIWLVAHAYEGHATPAVYWTIGLGTAALGAVIAALLVPTVEEEL